MKRWWKKKPDTPLNPQGELFRSAATDPQGSYTGNPQEPYEVPVQDVDDL